MDSNSEETNNSMSNTMDIKVPVLSDLISRGESADVLFWVGCAGAYDDRYQKVTRDFVKILDHLSISYAVLGTEESCTGDPAKRAGNEFLFQMQAMKNIEVMNGYKVTRIITACPHCFNTLKNEYPELGGQYEVVHHSTFLQQLINEGKLKVREMVILRERQLLFMIPVTLVEEMIFMRHPERSWLGWMPTWLK